MAIYIPRFNPLKSIMIRVKNFHYVIDNVTSKIKFNRKKLAYNDIIRIEYECIETTEFIFENMCVDKKIEDKNSFNELIKVLKENSILKWKKHYVANYEYYDGTFWTIKITFKNNEIFETSGDITFPRNFNRIYKEFEKFLITSDDEELNKMIINKWFKSN